MALPVFGFVTVHQRPLADGIAREAEWLARVAETGRAAAHLWEGAPGFVVPRSYERLPGWAAARAMHPVQVRASGGGLVPQGPGVCNLSLAWPAGSATPSDTDAVYRELCAGIAAALARFGVQASPQPVEGSFCDGRYNLAVGGRKLVGTAQSWRRVGGVPVVLAHAVIVVDADPAALTDAANAFEAALGRPPPYRAEALTSVARACAQASPDLAPRLKQALAQTFARLLPPRLPHWDEIAPGSSTRDG